MSQLSPRAGDAEDATYSNIPNPTSGDWIGLYARGSLDRDYIDTPRFTNGTDHGVASINLPGTLASGTYELRLFPQRTFSLMTASQPFSVSALPPADLACVQQVGQTCAIGGDAGGSWLRVGSGTLDLFVQTPFATNTSVAPILYAPTSAGIEVAPCTIQAAIAHCQMATVGNLLRGALLTVRFHTTYGAIQDVLGLTIQTGQPSPTPYPQPTPTPGIRVRIDTTGDVGQHTSLKIDQGTVVVSYYDVTNRRLKILRCLDYVCAIGLGPSSSGSTIAAPDPATNVGQFNSLALDSLGNPVVSYYDAANTRLKVLHCGNRSCTAPLGCGSGQTCITTPDPATNVGQFTSLALDPLGRPVVSYYDAGTASLKILHCGNATCTSGNTIATADTVGSGGAYTSLALDTVTVPNTAPAGEAYPVVSYYDSGNARLKVLHCGNSACTSANRITSPDAATNVGQFTSLALDYAGIPTVSYYDAGNTRLKVLHCGNVTCTSGNTIASPDPALNVGQFSSLVLDTTTNPAVSYYDATNHSLKVLRCGNVTCTSSNVIATLDNTANVGQFSSLQLFGPNHPVVTYYDATNGDLKLIRCRADASGCADFSPP